MHRREMLRSAILEGMKASKEEKVWGEVTDVLPGLQFLVSIAGKELRCYVAGKMRMSKVRLVRGDRVEVVPSPDGVRGRITWRG